MSDMNTTATFKADISSLRAEMQAAAREVRLANSEFKAATAGMDDWSDSADGLEAKIKQLNTVLQAQNKQVELAAQELEKTEKAYGENSAEADRAKIKYNNFKAAAQATEKELNSYEQQLDEVEDSTEEVGDATKEASEGFTVMKGVLADLAASAVKSAVRGLTNVAKETFKVGADFESAMSQVQAVSGASADEIQQLTDKAKEMGSKTKFSATESAAAFNYMAMAGWKTEDMLDGIDGIMNLAAASGADLATTSDIVTDALTAFGASAADAGKLADIMAAASSNANTNVEMMGATFQYVAPIAGSLGYDMEDTAVAIGLMANAGIKGEKAGTALRSIMTRLSTNTDGCADALSEMGVEVVNSDGSMRDLSDVMSDLMSVFDGLSESQQVELAKSIAGQEAMAGLLAIVNAAPEDFENLTNAVENSNGAAERMAEIMNDNVNGSLTLLKSNIEGKMIDVFEAASPAIKDAIDKISQALDSLDWDAIADGVGKLAGGFADFVTYVVDNSDTVKGLLEGIGAVIGTVFVVDKISDFISSLKNISSVVSSVAEKFTTLGSNAQGADEKMGLLSATMLDLPAMAVIAGLAALAAAVVDASDKYEEQIQKEYGLSEAQQQTIQSAQKIGSEYDDMAAKRSASFSSITTEYGYLEELVTEYQSLLDENGKVKTGYEERANFITSTLAEALGVEQSEIQESIEKNDALAESIKNLIEQKKAEAMLSAARDGYVEAIQKRTEAFTTYQDAVGVADEAEAKYKATQAAVQEAQENLNEAMEKDPRGSGHYAQVLEEANHKNEVAKEAYETASKGVESAEKAYTGYMTTIKNYEGLSSAIIAGDADKIGEALLDMQYDFQTAETGTKASLKKQTQNFQQLYKDLKKAVQSGAPGVTQAQVDEAKHMVEKSKAELDKLEPEAKEAGEKSGKAHAEGLKSTQNENEKTGKQVGKSSVKGVKDGSKEAEPAGAATGKKYAQGVSSQAKSANQAGIVIGKNSLTGAKSVSGEVALAGLGAATGYVNKFKSQDSAANSAGRGIGQNAYSGAASQSDSLGSAGSTAGSKYSSGVSSQTGGAYSAGSSVASSAKSGLDSQDATSSGTNLAQGFIDGISSLVSAAASAAASLASAASEKINAVLNIKSPSKVTFQSGVYFTQGFINGIVSERSTLINTVKEITGAVIRELDKVSDYNFEEVGENASTLFGDSFEKQTNYMINKIQYQNQAMLDDFDKTISGLEKQRDKEVKKLQADSDSRLALLEKALKVETNHTKEYVDSAKKAEADAIKKLQAESDKTQKKLKEESNKRQKELRDQISSEDDKTKKESLKKDLDKETNNLKKRIDVIKANFNKQIEARKAQTKEEVEWLNKNGKARQEQIKEEIKIEKENTKKEIDSIKSNYEKLITNQERYQDQYNKASEEMLGAFQDAMNAYQNSAQDLIDKTIEGITDRYNDRYDDLISKQDSLIDKLKDAGDLFNVSGAGVMTVNDLQKQTAQIRDYTDKLQKIKEKVSSELFDQIASYDMKEGSAFIDRLLAMSSEDLNAYNKAYAEKMQAAQKAGESIYKSDFGQIAADYKNEIGKAFKDIPSKLEDLGIQTMKGFVDGLTKNTDYMEKNVKTFVSSMVEQFKSLLKIKSPSRVMFEIGEYTSEGFNDGLMSMIGAVKSTASDLAAVISQPIDFSRDVSSLRSSVPGSYTPTAGGIVNNYNLVQNNNSPKALSALETYQARRRQIALVKAFA